MTVGRPAGRVDMAADNRDGAAAVAAGSTIVAPATPHGTGAVSILRLSGPEAFRIGRALTGLDPERAAPRTLSRCEVSGPDGVREDAGLAAFFPAPHSYTGEDIVEIHLHGNPLIVERVAAAALGLGAVPASPGEFSRRAFLNGKMDLTQAEGLADLIRARTEGAARAALRQLEGGIGKAVAPIRDGMLSLLVEVEAAIDFSDEEDVSPVDATQLQERISKFRQRLAEWGGSYSIGHRMRDGAVVTIAGVVNVGKSLLLNRILGIDRAIVTGIPGTTRDYLSAEINLSGFPVRLVDTAGLRRTDDEVEKEGVRRSREIIAGADLTLFLLDRSRHARAEDRDAYGEVRDRPHLVILNKSDLPARGSGEGFDGAGRRGVFTVSAATGEGIGALLDAVAREIVPEAGAIMAEAPLTRLRHLEAVGKAEEALRRAGEAVRGNLPPEFVAADLRDAAKSLAELTGEIAPEEVLDAIFGSFCIGK